VSITAIASQSGGAAQASVSMERAATQVANKESMAGNQVSNQVRISFEPPVGANAPMDQIGSGILDTMRNFEQSRVNKRESMSMAQGGPASPVSAMKQELLAGPASIRPASGGEFTSVSTEPVGVEDAISAMTRSFDYAIETQLIVKTGSQFSTSASSLMRGQ